MNELTPENGTRQIIGNLHRQRDELMRLPPEKALERIMDAEHPAALVHALADQDFHVLVNEIGPEDALPVLALASERQWEHLLDVEGWAADRLALADTDRRLDLLYRADPNRLVRWLASDHTEFLELYFYRTIEVYIREHDQDPSTLPPDCVTLDDVFYYRIMERSDPDDPSPRDPELYQRLATNIIERLADHDHIFYQNVLLETVSIIPAEVEEESYRLRNVRMAEKGFLPFDEAVGIYQAPPAAGTDGAGNSTPRPQSEAQHRGPAPVLPAALTAPGNIFSKALAHTGSDERRGALQVAFAGLCNRIGVADQAVVKSRRDLEAIVSKTTGYLGIALELLAGEDRSLTPETAAAIMASRPLVDLFKVGYGAAAALKHQADRWRGASWFQRQRLPLSFWGTQWMGVLGGLLIKRPLYFDNYRSGVIYREFATLAEVSETRNALTAAMAMDALLDAIALRPPPTKPPLLIYKNLLLTAWARDRHQLDGPLSPVGADTMRRFFTWLWNAENPPFTIDDTRRSAFVDWLAARSGMPADEMGNRYGQVLDALFNEIEEELGSVAIRDLEPRYVSQLLLVAPSSSQK
ncbi:MAG: DUF6178 family protein [Pseudomonadota bacterium]